jgi:hypothetical protein
MNVLELFDVSFGFIFPRSSVSYFGLVYDEGLSDCFSMSAMSSIPVHIPAIRMHSPQILQISEFMRMMAFGVLLFVSKREYSIESFLQIVRMSKNMRTS